MNYSSNVFEVETFVATLSLEVCLLKHWRNIKLNYLSWGQFDKVYGHKITSELPELVRRMFSESFTWLVVVTPDK